MGQIFYYSDPHIGHQYVAGLRGYEDPDEHDAMLAAKWDSVVNPHGDRGDQVWVLGDISAGGDKAQRKALAWLMQRRGTKHLITGNHDGCHPMNRDSHKWQKTYLGAFDSVQPFARKKIAGRYVLLSHFPYQGAGDRGPEERYPQYRLPDEGLWLMHGHTHSDERFSRGPLRWDGQDRIAGSPMIHVGVDAWDFSPIPQETIEQMILAEEDKAA